ncbi:phosphohydrolase [Lachnoanaerobaculum gingivalis]
METGKAYIVIKNIFNFKVGQILTLIRYGYQAYFGEYNFVFTDLENKNICVVLRGDDEEDMKIYHHLNEYFEEPDDNTNL